MCLRHVFALAVAFCSSPVGLWGQSSGGHLTASATITVPPGIRTASEMKVVRKPTGEIQAETTYSLLGRSTNIVLIRTALRSAEGTLLEEQLVGAAGRVVPGETRAVRLKLAGSADGSAARGTTNLVFVIAPDS